MRWVKHSYQSNRFYWILAGTSTVVEQQLSQSQAQVRMLEKRVKALETTLGIDTDSAASDQGIKAY